MIKLQIYPSHTLTEMHTTTETTTKVIITHTYYNFFSLLQRFFSTVLYMGNNFHNFFLINRWENLKGPFTLYTKLQDFPEKSPLIQKTVEKIVAVMNKSCSVYRR